MESTVKRFDSNNSVELSLNRPSKLNVLNDEVISELRSELHRLSEEESIDLLFLSGQGPKGLCAGGDVVNVIQYQGEGDKGQFFKAEYEVDLMIHNFKKPIISLCHGIIMGGGVGLVNGSHLKIFEPHSIFAMPEITIGFFPDVGSSYFLNRLERKWCLFLALTGARLDAHMAYGLGLCDYVVDTSYWNELKSFSSITEIEEFCKQKHEVSDFNDRDFQALDVVESMVSIEQFDKWAREYVSDSDGNSWIISSLKIYLQGSPLSAYIIWSYFNWAHNKTIEQCFDMDYQLGCKMLEHSDFREGVRALLIDKDKNPQWRFKSISQIDRDTRKFFDNLLF